MRRYGIASFYFNLPSCFRSEDEAQKKSSEATYPGEEDLPLAGSLQNSATKFSDDSGCGSDGSTCSRTPYDSFSCLGPSYSLSNKNLYVAGGALLDGSQKVSSKEDKGGTFNKQVEKDRLVSSRVPPYASGEKGVVSSAIKGSKSAWSNSWQEVVDSADYISLDVSRTFPHLCIFQQVPITIICELKFYSINLTFSE